MVIIVNGAPESGKTTFINYCRSLCEVYKSRNFSTVDLVKTIARSAGWNGVKDAASRKFLSDLKDLMTNFNDAPANDVVRNTLCFYSDSEMWTDDPDRDTFVFIDCREPKEIAKLVERFSLVNVSVTTLIVRRPQAESSTKSNHADANVLNYTYDCEVINEGTLDDLLEMAETFLEDLKNGYHH